MYQIIVNPSARSGRGRKNWERVKNILDAQKVDYEVHFTQKHGDSSDFANSLYEKYTENGQVLELIVMGGDGTLNEVIQGLPSFENVSLSCIPIGSSNDLARALNISPIPEEAITHLLNKPTTLYMDLGTVKLENSLVREGNMTIPSRRFLVSCGIGYDASICNEALKSSVKNFFNRLGLGKLSYYAICLKQLIFMKTSSIELFLNEDDPVRYDKVTFAVAMNNLYEGGGFQFAPEANNHDGLLSIMVCSNVSKFKILTLLPTALTGDHLQFKGIYTCNARKFAIRSSKPLWVHTDGEVETKADYIECECDKEAVRIVY